MPVPTETNEKSSLPFFTSFLLEFRTFMNIGALRFGGAVTLGSMVVESQIDTEISVI